jgi:hypothetical protein
MYLSANYIANQLNHNYDNKNFPIFCQILIINCQKSISDKDF